MSLYAPRTPEEERWQLLNYSGLPAGAPPLSSGAPVPEFTTTAARITPMEDQGIDWGGIISGSTDSFLRIYSTVTQKPIAQESPNSVMDYIVGTDYGRPGGGIVQAPAMGGATLLLLGGVVILAIMAFRK